MDTIHYGLCGVNAIQVAAVSRPRVVTQSLNVGCKHMGIYTGYPHPTVLLMCVCVFFFFGGGVP